MKSITLVLTAMCSVVILIAVCLTASLSAQSVPGNSAGGTPPIPKPLTNAPVALLAVDPFTLAVIGPDYMADTIQYLNAPEEVEERRRAQLALLAPDIYFQLYPKTQTEIDADAKAADSIRAPKDEKTFRKDLSPEQIAAHVSALAAIMTNKGPGPSVFPGSTPQTALDLPKVP
jgi:hypothetical protein